MNLDVEDGRSPAVIDLAPMIDVIFQLLIFFMVTTTFLHRERQIEIDLPVAETGSDPSGEEEVVVNVHRDGRIGWGKDFVAVSELDHRLRAVAAVAPERPVTIRGDREARHEWIMNVMDACGRAGLGNLNVATLETP